MAQFAFSAQELVDAIKEKWDTIDGYDVQGVFDSAFASRSFSETLDMIGANSSESGHNPWDPPCQSIYKDGLIFRDLEHSDKLHHKYAVIDGQVVITGSHNWSATANHDNDENTLFIHNARIANQYEQEFQARVGEGRLLTVGD